MEYCAKSELHPASAGLGMLKGAVGISPRRIAARMPGPVFEKGFWMLLGKSSYDG